MARFGTIYGDWNKMRRKTDQFRILVTGTHGVGKTTMVHQFARQISSKFDVGVVPETARILASKGFSVNDEISVDGVHEYVRTYEMNFQKAENAILIADRGIMDLYLYTKHLYGRGTGLNRKLGNMVLERAKADLRRYDIVVFVPIEFSLETDDVRPTSGSFQREIENRTRDFLEDEGVEYTTVGGTLAERMAKLHHAMAKSANFSVESLDLVLAG